MADDAAGAVRRTPRPTPRSGDHQTHETAPQWPAGTTNTASPVSGDQLDVSSRVSSQDDPAFQAATLAVLEALNPIGPDDLQPNRSTEFARYVAEQVETALIGEGWRRPKPEYEAALAALRAKLAEEPDSVLFPGPECDMEAYAALPPCTACEGGGQDTHGTVFEAPLAVHFAGPPVEIVGRRRQLCMWCGHVLRDGPRVGPNAVPPWPVGVLLRIEDGVPTVVPHEPGDELPPGCCALPDDEGVDPIDGYAADLCGKHTGTCSNRCLLPAHHSGECDDDPEPSQAQETRAAADWPPEPVDTPADGDHD